MGIHSPPGSMCEVLHFSHKMEGHNHCHEVSENGHGYGGVPHNLGPLMLGTGAWGVHMV